MFPSIYLIYKRHRLSLLVRSETWTSIFLWWVRKPRFDSQTTAMKRKFLKFIKKEGIPFNFSCRKVFHQNQIFHWNRSICSTWSVRSDLLFQWHMKRQIHGNQQGTICLRATIGTGIVSTTRTWIHLSKYYGDYRKFKHWANHIWRHFF